MKIIVFLSPLFYLAKAVRLLSLLYLKPVVHRLLFFNSLSIVPTTTKP